MQAAVLVALIGFLESIAIAKAFARKKNYEVPPPHPLTCTHLGSRRRSPTSQSIFLQRR